MIDQTTANLINVLSIDAWRNNEGWDWNAWYKAGTLPRSACSLSVRKLLRLMREEGYLTGASAGKVAIDDDGYNVVILDRHTREPLFALEYGAGA